MLNLRLPKISTGPFNFTSQAQAKPHKRGKGKKALPLLEWMEKYRRELKPGQPFDLKEHAFLRALYELSVQRMVVKKSGQAGVSEYLISYALWCCDQRDLNVFYLFPTDAHVSDFSAERLGLALESSEYLSGIVVSGRGATPDGVFKRGVDKVTQKRIRDRFLYFRGGQVKPTGLAPQLKSVPADVLITDEWDEVDRRAPIIAHERLGHSRVAEERAVSTPTYLGRGIDAEYNLSDQREWHICCHHCGQWQPLSIHQVVTEWDSLDRPVAWHGQHEGRAYCACIKCGKELDRLSRGEWVAKMPSVPIVGYHISKLFSPLYDPLNAVERLRSTNETERRECYNQVLGLGYKPRGGGLDDVALDACLREYMPNQHRGVYMGIDVDRPLHVIVRGRPDSETGERPQVFAGEATWDQLPNLWRRYRPAVTVIDGGPEGTKAREFQATAPTRIWLAFYQDDMKDEAPIRVVDDERHLLLDRTRTIDLMVERFSSQENTLPANGRDIPTYYDQMKAAVRVIEKTTKGLDVSRWVESGADHYFHAENYCAAASMLPRVGAPMAQGATKGW